MSTVPSNMINYVNHETTDSKILNVCGESSNAVLIQTCELVKAYTSVELFDREERTLFTLLLKDTDAKDFSVQIVTSVKMRVVKTIVC